MAGKVCVFVSLGCLNAVSNSLWCNILQNVFKRNVEQISIVFIQSLIMLTVVSILIQEV
jgi:hypothetical protein